MLLDLLQAYASVDPTHEHRVSIAIDTIGATWQTTGDCLQHTGSAYGAINITEAVRRGSV